MNLKVDWEMSAETSGGSPLREPTDFGDGDYHTALVNVTNACNLDCAHCFVFRADNPNNTRDKMDDRTMLHQLEVLRDKHDIRSMLFMGGEPMIRKDLVMEAVKLFENPSIVTNGTYGIPSLPGGLVTVSLDGPEEFNDAIRGPGVFRKVKAAIAARDREDGTTVMLQMTVTKPNAHTVAEFVEVVKDWPIDGIAFTFFIPIIDDQTGLAWHDLRERDEAVRRVIAVKQAYPDLVKAQVPALEMMFSDVCQKHTGDLNGECVNIDILPLYLGKDGSFERPYCCYGNKVDCTRCGSYSLFNTVYHRETLKQENYVRRSLRKVAG